MGTIISVPTNAQIAKKTSQFVPLSDAPTLWLTSETRSLKIGSNN
jgi:hypothetical protein